MSPEVLIYIQHIKKFFESDQKTKKYFIGVGNEELFYKKLSQLSQKKFDTEGEHTLTKEEFEELRNEFNTRKELFMNVGDFGKICLN
jgi:hypothetical protein